jgi:hypothetical protein
MLVSADLASAVSSLAKLNYQVAGQVLRTDLAAFFLPESDEGSFFNALLKLIYCELPTRPACRTRATFGDDCRSQGGSKIARGWPDSLIPAA